MKVAARFPGKMEGTWPCTSPLRQIEVPTRSRCWVNGQVATRRLKHQQSVFAFCGNVGASIRCLRRGVAQTVEPAGSEGFLAPFAGHLQKIWQDLHPILREKHQPIHRTHTNRLSRLTTNEARFRQLWELFWPSHCSMTKEISRHALGCASLFRQHLLSVRA